MVNNIFKEVRYTDEIDILSGRLARLNILGLPLHTWTLVTLNKIARIWGNLISSKPNTTRANSFINPSILI